MRTLARAPERSSPRQRVSPSVGGAGQVVGQRGDLEHEVVLELVGLGHHPPEPGLRLLVVGAVHEQEPSMRKLPISSTWSAIRRTSSLASSGWRRRCRSRWGGTRPAPSSRRGPPTRSRLVDDRRHAPPHHGVLQPGQAQDLGHLGDVAEHVGQVADLHGPPEGRSPGAPSWRSRMMVSPETRNSSIRMYQGPIESRPAAARARIRSSFSGLISR
jgi:hypothetical protein